RRNARKVRCLNRGVAVTAIDSKRADVVLVAERHWLDLCHAHVIDIRRALHFFAYPCQPKQDKYGAKNGKARNAVGAAMEDLRHSLGYRVGRKRTRRPRGSLLKTSIFGNEMERITAAPPAQGKPSLKKWR